MRIDTEYQIADNCCVQEFNKEPQEILMNYEYEYIEVKMYSESSQLCLGVFSLSRNLSDNF